MKLRQLQLLLAVVRNEMNISAAAAALHTSQPSVSRQIIQLEEEVGATLFTRRKNRMVGLTPIGEAAFEAARRIENQIANIDLIAREARDPNEGSLSVVTSHLHARYTMLEPMRALRRSYPGIHVTLLQADPDRIQDMVRNGDADIGMGVSYQAGKNSAGLIILRGDLLRRMAIFPKDHPLATKREITLADLCSYDMIGFTERSRTGRIVSRALQSAGLNPRISVRVNDSDVVKAYVTAGLGVGIVPNITIKAHDDLAMSDITDQMPKRHISVVLRDDMHMRQSVIALLESICPQWNAVALQREISKARSSG